MKWSIPLTDMSDASARTATVAPDAAVLPRTGPSMITLKGVSKYYIPDEARTR